MQNFNYRKADNAENCGKAVTRESTTCRAAFYAGTCDKATRGDHRCGLYIRQQVKEKTEPEGQEELF